MEKHKLLLIDDEDSIITSYSALLAPYFIVDTCSTVEEGILQLSLKDYSIAVIDMQFPSDKEGGLSIVKHIAAMNMPTKAIVLTAYGTVKNCKKNYEVGVYDYIEKGKDDTPQTLLEKALEASGNSHKGGSSNES